MKRLILILAFLVYSISSICQSTLNGIYLDDRDTLNFYTDSISFSIMSNGGFIIPMEGKGKFNLKDNYLIILTESNPNKPIKEKTPIEFGDREYLEHKTIVFKIKQLKENQLDLILLGICENTNFKGQKTIRKFERNHKKFTYRDRFLNRIN
tara:strand:- start:187 stop:642 length:456 start_codon:yes stop_codon:yes gene_type:complete